jgi:hypothetical protein
MSLSIENFAALRAPWETPATVKLIREVLYCEPDQLGEKRTVVAFEDVADPDGIPNASRLMRELPEPAWGWQLQTRLETWVEYEGAPHILTTPYVLDQSGTTFVDGRLVDRNEIDMMVRDQQLYRSECYRKGLPVGALPHGQDKGPILSALDRGEMVIVTRHGNYRDFNPERDTLLESDTVPELILPSSFRLPEKGIGQ